MAGSPKDVYGGALPFRTYAAALGMCANVKLLALDGREPFHLRNAPAQATGSSFRQLHYPFATRRRGQDFNDTKTPTS